MNAKIENARTLASILGRTEDEAAALLEVEICVTFDSADDAAGDLSSLVSRILGRTVARVVLNGNPECAQAEVALGASRATNPVHVAVRVDSHSTTIGPDLDPEPLPPSVPRILLLIAACHATGRILRRLLGDRLAVSAPPPNATIELRHDWFVGNDQSWIDQDINLQGTFLAGAGAIGNAVLFAIGFFRFSGELMILDPDLVTEGNLNRCLFFEAVDIKSPKAPRLAQLASSHVPGLRLSAERMTLQQYGKAQKNDNWLNRLIVGVDSRRVRRHLQGEIPGEVFDASTTGAYEVVFHHHRQPTDAACLACIYHEEPNELAREQHIAEALGVTLADVKQHHVSAAAAQRIHERYQEVPVEEMEGQAFDSLFKALCGEGKLRSAEGQQVLAPFAFVSVLAGTILVIELARRIALGPAAETFNYWRANPWGIPNLSQQIRRPRHSKCEFCSSQDLLSVAARLWTPTL